METLFYKLMYDRQLKRSMRTLEILYKSKYSVTIKELEKQLQVSQKTVLSTLHLAESLLPNDISLEVINKNIILHNDTNQSIEVVLIDIAKQTIPFQVLEHVFFDGNLNIRELAEKLFTSESTLRIRIAHMNKILATYKCRISFYDVKLLGEESNIRLFFYAYFSEFQELFISVTGDRLQYCFDIYNSMKQLLTQHGDKLLNYSYQQVERWLLITRDRMELGKFVSIRETLANRIRKRPSYQYFKDIFKSEITHHLNISTIPESEVIWGYILGFNCIIYINDDNRSLYYSDSDNKPYAEKITAVLNSVASILKVLNTDRENFFAVHTAYLLNLSLLAEISPLLQLSSDAVKNYVATNLMDIYVVWQNCLSDLLDEGLFPNLNTESVATQLALISSPFIYHQKAQPIKALYSFEGEPGLMTHLDMLAKTLLPSNIESVFVHNDPLTIELLKQIQPDVIICNHQLPKELDNYNVFRMSYVPQLHEWSLLKDFIAPANIIS